MKSDRSKTKTELIRELKSLRTSEQNYRQLFQRAPLSYQSLDLDGNIITINHSWLQLLGYKESEVIGRWFGDFLAPEFVEHFRKNFPRLKAAGKISDIQYQMVTKKGLLIDVEFEGRIGYNSAGEFQQTQCILADITERKQAEAALRDSESQNKLLIENAHESIISISNDGKLLLLNKAAAAFFGGTPEDFIGKTVWDIFPKEVADTRMTDNWAVIQSGKSQTMEHSLSFQGKTHWFLTSRQAIRGSSGDMFVLNISKDITERKQAETALRESEERFKKLSNLTFEGILIHDKGVAIDINESFAIMFGYKREELIGKNLIQLLIPREFHSTIMDNIVKESAKPYEVMARKKDGTIFPVEIEARDVKGENEEIRVTAIRDITVRKQIEKALEESELKFRLLADYTYDWIYWKGLDGIYIYLSPSCKRITGYGPEEFISNPELFHEIIRHDYADKVHRHIKDESNLQEPLISMEFPIITKTGEECWLEHNCSPVFDDQGKFCGRRGNNRDISERKQAEEAIREASQLKELLLDIITHDIKNPAGNIRNAVELLKDRFPSNEIMDIIKGSSDKLLNVMENATVLAQVATGEKIEMKETNLTEVIQSAVKGYTQRLDRSGMTIELDLPDTILLQANSVISEVFKNYISNAIKYASDGKKIVIDGNESKEHLIINVKDFGTTIPEEHRQKIFERTYQIDSNKKGRGLGLAIVKRIAEAHNAEVGVKPNEPTGNIFCIKLPTK